VNEPAESVVAADLARIEDCVELDWDGEGRRLLVERVRPVLVVVRHVDAEHPPEMSMTEDQQPIHALPPKGSEPSSRRGDMVEDIEAVPAVLVHLADPHDLSLDPPQPPHDVLVVVVHGSSSSRPLPFSACGTPVGHILAERCRSRHVPKSLRPGPKDCYRPASRRKANTLQEQRVQCHKKARA
jgi:hypothetical protein